MEVILAVTLTLILSLGIAKTYSASISSLKYSQNTAFTSSGNSTMTSMITKDIEQANAFIIPTSTGVDTVTGASGDGSSVTYTYSGHNTLVTGQNISISTLTPAGYNLTNATIAAVTGSTTFTVSNGTIGNLTRTGNLFTTCSTWNPTDTTFVNIRPLLSISQQASTNVLSATGTGTSATYSYTGQVHFDIGQSVTVSGLTPTLYNTINATITATDSVAKTFTLANIGVGSTASSGIAIFNNYIGYEVRLAAGSTGALWRVNCSSPQTANSSATAQLLREGLPIPSSSSDWTNAVQCTNFSSGAISSLTCSTNKFLNSAASNPGLSITIPATLAGVTSVYQSQIIMAARSIS